MKDGRQENTNALSIILENAVTAVLLWLINLGLVEEAILQCPDVDEMISYELTERCIKILRETDHDDDSAA